MQSIGVGWQVCGVVVTEGPGAMSQVVENEAGVIGPRVAR